MKKSEKEWEGIEWDGMDLFHPQEKNKLVIVKTNDF